CARRGGQCRDRGGCGASCCAGIRDGVGSGPPGGSRAYGATDAEPLMYETITVDSDARGVTRLTLNRPEKHNALSATMIAELTEAAGRLGRDPAVRAIVLTGAGESFCAGGDLGWMRE